MKDIEQCDIIKTYLLLPKGSLHKVTRTKIIITFIIHTKLLK